MKFNQNALCWLLGTRYAILRREQSIDIHRKDNKMRGGSRQGVAANAWGDHDTGPKSQNGSNLGNGGKGKEWLYRHVVS